uniref:Oxysterol-binding protein n=1 Tax=Panagrellus redivivus TaxID=6233 RepID=A0A7E4ZZZ4_PANRE
MVLYGITSACETAFRAMQCAKRKHVATHPTSSSVSRRPFSSLTLTVHLVRLICIASPYMMPWRFVAHLFIRSFVHPQIRHLWSSVTMPKSGSTSSHCDEPLTCLPRSAHIEKAGFLQKWTNYLKGYRQRWFVLDSNGILSYYRGREEVGHACRGSLNLQESQIHTDPATCNLTISASSQAFHLKAQNEVDRQEWLNALEYARHRAIKKADSDEDDDNAASTISDVRNILEGLSTAMDQSSTDVRSLETQIKKILHEISKTAGSKAEDKIQILKQLIDQLIVKSSEAVVTTKKETRSLVKYISNEHEQRVRLQEQIETLAKQHSKLERAAFNSTSTEQPPFTDSDEEFHDAVDEFHDVDGSQQGSIDEHDRDFFTAEIVTPRDSWAGGDTHPASQMTAVVPANAKHGIKQRRGAIPERPQGSISLWSIMRNCIGKELTKIPMPVNFNEPLSVLQRITEDLEYAYLLDRAADKDPLLQMCYVAAYAVSCYSTTGNRTTKPFNPLLGETYECDRTDDLGWRSITEQVSHHPPATAHHAEGTDWSMFQDFYMTSRFRGKYLSVTPTGLTHVSFKNSGNVYSYRKITTTVHNIIVGKLWIDNHGEMVIENHKTGDKCTLKFHAYSYFSSEKPRKVTGVVKDANGVARYCIQGYWDKSIDVMEVTKYEQHDKQSKSVIETNSPRRLWTINPPYPNNEKMYYFTKLAIELNEEDDTVAPTDSRRRPDQRLMEQGNWDEANNIKNEVEERQRIARKKRDAEAEQAMVKGLAYPEYAPLWFEKAQDEHTGSVIHVYKGNYWECKNNQDWSMCPTLF